MIGLQFTTSYVFIIGVLFLIPFSNFLPFGTIFMLTLIHYLQQFVDFSPKGGPEKMAVTYEDGAIVFPDGNKWTKVARGTPDRRPKDMSTLKSAE